jgi:hypothetical protein
MIPKSGHRFSDQIMRNKKSKNPPSDRPSSDQSGVESRTITIGDGAPTKERKEK